MAFEGNLSELEFGDVVQTLSMTRQYGTLVVQGAELRRVLFSDTGLALLSERRSDEEQVAEILVAKRQCHPDSVKNVLRATRRDANAAIGDMLLQQGAVSEADLLAARRYVAGEQFFDLFARGEGEFEFHADELHRFGPFADISFGVNSIAMEAARRIDERPRLNELVPLDEVFVPYVEQCAPQAGQASDDALQVFALADGSRTVHNIVSDYHLGAFDTRKVVADLIEHRALRPATRSELLMVAEHLGDGVAAVQLLRRALTLDPMDFDARERLCNALVAVGDKSQAAALLADLAQIQHMEADPTGALESLQEALKLDRDNPAALAIRTSILFSAGEVDDGIEAATECVSRALDRGDPSTALQITEEALQYRPDDLLLCRLAAQANAALGAVPEALAILDRLAAGLREMSGQEAELVDVYKTILSIAPDRSDCRGAIAHIQAAQVARRQRKVRMLAAAGVLLVVSAIAVPIFLSPGLEGRVSEAQALLDSGDVDAAQAILDELDPGDDVDAQILVTSLRSAIEIKNQPPASDGSGEELVSAADGLYAESARLLGDGQLDEGLAVLEQATGLFTNELGRKAQASAPDLVSAQRRALSEEAHVALTTINEQVTAQARWAGSTADQFSGSNALKRAAFTVEPDDLEELQKLAELAREADEAATATNWDELVASIERLIVAARPKDPSIKDKIAASVNLLVENLDRARSEGERAVAYVDRSRLLTRFREVKEEGGEWIREGRLEAAADLYREYLQLCDSVSASERGETYREIIEAYMDTLPLESLHREQLQELDIILEQERKADSALAAGNVADAFRVRVDLVRQYPSVGFSRRFQLPMRVESEPPDAEIEILDSTGERIVGRTPATIEYPVSGHTGIVIRLEGFEEVRIDRNGAVDDTTSEEHVELVKRPVWSVDGEAVTEATPAVWQDRVFIADRDGVVRALSLADGTELARAETNLLGGFTSAPAAFEGRLFVAGVDGVGFVLDARTLDVVRRIEIGAAVRPALLTTKRGVVLCDDRGRIRLLDRNGDERWSRTISTVMVDPAKWKDGVVVVTMDGRLMVLSLATGVPILDQQVPGRARWSAPVVVADRAYVSSEAGLVASLDLSSGKVLWERTLEEPLTGRPGVTEERYVLVNSLSGELCLLREGEDGEPAKDPRPCPPGDGIVTTVHNSFVVAGRTGIVRHVDIAGRSHWRYDAAGALSARPLVTEKLAILVTRSGRVIALEL